MPRGLSVVTAAAQEPVSLTEAKAQCRVDIGDDDDLIRRYIAGARRYLENAWNLALVTQTLKTSIDRFPRYSSSAVWQYNSDAIWQQRLPVTQLSGQWYPDRASIRLTRPPLQQLLAITYMDGSGITQSLVNTIAAGVPAPGAQAVTPATMTGVAVGNQFVVDFGSAAAETVTVTAATATTFSANFASAHPANVTFEQTPGGWVNVDTSTQPARVAPAYGQIWPIVRQRLASVQVTYLAGYGDATAVPETYKQAILLIVGHWYQNREAVGQVGGEVAMAVDSLMWSEWCGEYE